MLIQWHHGSGDFATAANWNPADVPGAGDDAEIDAAGTYTVTSSASETVITLTTVATATLVIANGSTFTMTDGTGTGANAGIIAIDNGSELNPDGTVDNTGRITLNATTASTGIDINSALTLTGNGKVVLSDNAMNELFILGPTLTNVNNTISGAGTLAAISGNFVNDAAGVVDATGIANPLILTTGSNPIVNAGILEATGPGGLEIKSSVENASTSVIAATGAHAVVSILDNSTVTGGTLKTASGGAIDVGAAGVTFDGSTPADPVTNTGSVVVLDSFGLTLLGTIDNSGTITLDSTGDPTTLTVGNGGAALEGGGKLVLTSTDDDDVITGAASTDTLTNVDNTIIGSGELGNGEMTLINEAKGVIDATHSFSFPSMILDTGSDVANAGLIEATAGGVLSIDFSTIDNAPTGMIEATGTNSAVIVDASGVVGGTLTSTNGGAIEIAGDSTFDGSTPTAPITDTGSVSVLDESTLTLLGTIDNNGTITLDSTGDLTQLSIGTGSAALEGEGKVVLAATGDNEITSVAPSDTLTNVSNTISGLGTISAALDNEAKGVVDATAANGSIVMAGNITNAGLLEATTGELVIDNTGVINTATGVIAAMGQSVVLEDGTIAGGTLKTAGGGTILISQADTETFDGSAPAAPISNTGSVAVDNGSTLTLVGTIDNSGTITLDTTGTATQLVIASGGAALEGGGKVTLAPSNDVITGVVADATLTNVDNTIAGGGRLGAGQMALVNDTKGVIDAANGGSLNPLIVDTGANEIVNAGLMEATTGNLLINSLVSNTGTIKSFGASVELESVSNNGALIAAMGTLAIDGADSGTGTATIDNGGKILFGSADTAITQNVTFADNGSADATLEFDALASASPTKIYDGVVSGFSTTKDQIDFAGLTFDGNTTPAKELVGGNTVLTVTEGAASVSVTLAGNHMADHFTIAKESGTGTGTVIVDPPASTLAATAKTPSLVSHAGIGNIALLGSYMASMFASAEGSIGAPTTEAMQSPAVLAHPHAG